MIQSLIFFSSKRVTFQLVREFVFDIVKKNISVKLCQLVICWSIKAYYLFVIGQQKSIDPMFLIVLYSAPDLHFY